MGNKFLQFAVEKTKEDQHTFNKTRSSTPYLQKKKLRTIVISDKNVSENKSVRIYLASEILTVQYETMKLAQSS